MNNFILIKSIRSKLIKIQILFSNTDLPLKKKFLEQKLNAFWFYISITLFLVNMHRIIFIYYLNRKKNEYQIQCLLIQKNKFYKL